MRQTAYRFHPSILDDLGLLKAVRRLVNDFSDRTGIQCSYVHGEIVDTTDLTAAMEAISIGQLEGGDWTGALHTAKLIPAEINRNSVLIDIAFEQARSGNVQGAIETVSHAEAPLRRNAILLGVLLIRAKDGDIPGALAAASSIENELSRARAYRNIAAVQTENGSY